MRHGGAAAFSFVRGVSYQDSGLKRTQVEVHRGRWREQGRRTDEPAAPTRNHQQQPLRRTATRACEHARNCAGWKPRCGKTVTGFLTSQYAAKGALYKNITCSPYDTRHGLVCPYSYLSVYIRTGGPCGRTVIPNPAEHTTGTTARRPLGQRLAQGPPLCSGQRSSQGPNSFPGQRLAPRPFRPQAVHLVTPSRASATATWAAHASAVAQRQHAEPTRWNTNDYDAANAFAVFNATTTRSVRRRHRERARRRHGQCTPAR